MVLPPLQSSGYIVREDDEFILELNHRFYIESPSGKVVFFDGDSISSNSLSYVRTSLFVGIACRIIFGFRPNICISFLMVYPMAFVTFLTY